MIAFFRNFILANGNIFNLSSKLSEDFNATGEITSGKLINGKISIASIAWVFAQFLISTSL